MKLNQYEWDPENDVLGNGAFAEVFRAKDNNGHFVALKIYRQAMVKGSTGGAAAQGKYTLEQEYKKGELLAHTNVIRYIGFDFIIHTDSMQRQVSYPVLIMEYAEGGTLAGWLKSTTPPDETQAVKITRELLQGLAYLHDQGIIHRDLKPGNILFKTDRKGNNVVKITDFGISRDLLEDNADRASTTAGVGTIEYMAPEQLLKKTYGLDGAISNRSDLWAVGVIFYRMLTGKLPFGNEYKDYESVHEQIIAAEPDYSALPGDRYQRIIKACLHKHASARPADAGALLKMLDQGEPERSKMLREPALEEERTRINTVVPDPAGHKKMQAPAPPPSSGKKGWGVKIILTLAAILVTLIVINMIPKIFRNSVASAPLTADTAKKRVDSLVKRPDTSSRADGRGSSADDKVYVTDKPIVLQFDDKSYQVTYTGFLKNGLPSGYGTKIFTSGDMAGDKYVGDSADGIANGKGRRYFHGGDYYAGEFKNGAINGKGTYVYANRDKYTGEFANGYQTGQGTMYYNRDDQFKGDHYDGQWYNGSFSGKGSYYWHDGRVYNGNWENGKQSGQGTMDFIDGSKYIGEWAEGKQNGSGSLYNKDGTLNFSGQFENGVAKSQ